MLRSLTLMVVTTALTMASLSAHAQSVCGEREAFLEKLSAGYHEAPVALGLVSTGSVLEVIASPSGTWTILITDPDGTTCVVAAGEAWHAPLDVDTDPGI